MYLSPFDSSVNPGIEDKRYAAELTAITLLQQEGLIPQSFPLMQWATQKARYLRYWSWFRGDALQESIGQTSTGQPVYKYPLKINPVRNFARKHAALLFGEVPDTPGPLVKHLVTPKLLLYPSGKIPEADKTQAKFYEELLGQLWTGSKGRSLQYENGVISQPLGGSVFNLQYQPWRDDLVMPLVIKNVYPDFFLPVWSEDDYWDLLEAYVIYKIPAASVRLRFPGAKAANLNNATYSVYVEHWTKDHYSYLLDNVPLEVKYGGVPYKYDQLPNPYGKVPFVYIPRSREGNFYGSSFIDDVEGLTYEYNARFADLGDAMRLTAQRRFVGRNITTKVTQKQFDNDQWFADLGQGIPGTNKDPELVPIDPPNWSESFTNVPNLLYQQLGRESGLGPIAFGEDEGSQRSALTLAFRMWPSTIVAKAQRTFWTDGLNQVADLALHMAATLGLKVAGRGVDKDFRQMVDLAPDWLPMIPRDREAQVNEIILRLQTGAISLEKALTDFGDVPDVQKEIEQIKDFQEWQAKLAQASKPKPGSAGGGADTDTTHPVVTDGLRD